jgi:hypothetical protein
MRGAKRWSRADGQDPIFSVEHYEAKRPGKPVLIYIGTFCSRGIREICFGTAARWGFRLLSHISLFSPAWFSLAVTSDRERDICIKKKEKKERNNYKPHVSCGFRIKLSSYRGMKEAERRRRMVSAPAMRLIPTQRSDPHGRTE